MAGGSTFTWSHALRLDSTKSPFDSPLPQTHRAFQNIKPVSWRRFNIGGILTTVYGLEDLPRQAHEIACLWLLHGRGDTQDSMGYTAAAMLHAWNSKRKPGQKGLICVCFDQRNHGSRQVENLNNNSWKQGNATHGPDMFNTYVGTSQDLSLLITQLPHYLSFKISQHICGGVSLGGHATWVVLMREPRVTAGMVIIGCPDYMRLMTDRAIRSKIPSTLTSEPPGRDFLGSQDFPQSLIAAVEQYDPAGILLGELDVYSFSSSSGNDDDCYYYLRQPPSISEVRRLEPIIDRSLAGKSIICLSGGKDRLVPYAQSEIFLGWLKRSLNADEDGGWWKTKGIKLEDVQDPTAGHEFSALMRREAERWLCDLLAGDDDPSSSSSSSSAGRDSKL